MRRSQAHLLASEKPTIMIKCMLIEHLRSISTRMALSYKCQRSKAKVLNLIMVNIQKFTDFIYIHK